MRSFPVPVLGFLYVSFRPSLFRSHSRSTGAYLPFIGQSFPVLSAFFRPLLSRFRLLCLCFFLSFLPSLCLTAALSGALFLLSLPQFPLPFRPVSRASLSVLSTWLSACFLSSFPASLPQPFHWCLPYAYAFGLSPIHSTFFRPLPFWDLTTQPLRFLFPSSRFSLAVVPPVLIYPLSVPPVSMLPFQLWYSAFCSSFLLLTFRLAAATSFASAFLSV